MTSLIPCGVVHAWFDDVATCVQVLLLLLLYGTLMCGTFNVNGRSVFTGNITGGNETLS